MISRGNWLIIKEYLDYLITAKQLANKSILTYRNYFRHLLLWAMEAPLWQAASIDPPFSDYLGSIVSPKSGRGLSRSTWERILGAVVRFYSWAKSYHSKEFSTVPQLWIDSLTVPQNVVDLSDNDYVPLEVVKLFANKYADTKSLVRKRDCAAAIMLYLSGMRSRAFVTLPLLAVAPVIPGYPSIFEIYQYPELGVQTKNSKRHTSQTLPIAELYECARDWDDFIRPKLPKGAPWFTVLNSDWGDTSLSPRSPGENRSQSLNRRLKGLFSLIDSPYQSAHKFRRGHAKWGLSHSKDIEQYKAVSLNLGHKSITITDQYYAKFNTQDRRRAIASLGES